MTRLLVPTSALFWGLQFAFLNPVIALLLVTLYGASAADVAWALAVYNAGGFIAALVVPAYADHTADYLRPLLVCGLLTFALAVALLIVSTLPLAAVALVVLGGPAGVGVSLLYAELRRSGAAPRDIIRTRAVVSFAWVAGPPLATFIIQWWGERSILLVLALLAVLNVLTSAMMIRQKKAHQHETSPTVPSDRTPSGSRRQVIALVVGFTALQATNSATVAVMGLFVVDTLNLPLIWSGVALGIAALLEIPALLWVGVLSERLSSRVLVASGCLCGVGFYIAMTFTTEPVLLIGAQVLNAWFFAVVAGIGLTLFQDALKRPGIASGLFLNTRRVGAIASGGIIAIGTATTLGYQGVFAVCAIVAVLAGLVLAVGVQRTSY